ncbi:MAG: HAMP domain-containing histidine kinase, partial [Flavobacteriales bacterium]|nr:HAMP domain-containing histidine kinase [Flavobacteriales bacterium]
FNKSVPSEELEFADVWDNVMKEVEHQIKESGIEIHADFDNLSKIWYPRFHLNSILLNLLTNAIKYAKPGERPRIRLKTEIKSNRPHLTFSDDGIGIDLERHGSKLFKLFKRFHDHVPGRGVGLHIVHSIVNSHGGYIDVESEVNKGTTFKILLLDEDE